jgi:hypothetical protein
LQLPVLKKSIFSRPGSWTAERYDTLPDRESTAPGNLGIHPWYKRCPVSGLEKPEEKEYAMGFIPQWILMIIGADEDVCSIIQLLSSTPKRSGATVTVKSSSVHGQGDMYLYRGNWVT